MSSDILNPVCTAFGPNHHNILLDSLQSAMGLEVFGHVWSYDRDCGVAEKPRLPSVRQLLHPLQVNADQSFATITAIDVRAPGL